MAANTAPHQARRKPLDHDPASVTWARKAKGWTQERLAKAARISPSLMSQIESGNRNAPPDVILRLARALNCPVSVLERKRVHV